MDPRGTAAVSQTHWVLANFCIKSPSQTGSHRNQPGELRKPHKKHVSINNVQDCSPNDQGSCHSKMFGNHWLRLYISSGSLGETVPLLCQLLNFFLFYGEANKDSVYTANLKTEGKIYRMKHDFWSMQSKYTGRRFYSQGLNGTEDFTLL